MILAAITLVGLTLSAAVPSPPDIVTKAVTYEHAGVQLEGFLAYDRSRVSTERPAPGVLVVPEWWGLNDYAKDRARQLASLGYVAFVADMYGAGVVTTDAKRAGELAGQFYGKPLMAERARAGLDRMLAMELVDKQHVAAIGYCFGGAVVQALAYSGAPLDGIVSFHGSLIQVPAEAASRTKVKLLVCHGAVDPFVSPEQLAAFTKAMNDGGFDYQFISYSGAVHAFTNPDADAAAAKNGLTGKVGYNAAADRRSWEHMKLFFREVLEGKQ